MAKRRKLGRTTTISNLPEPEPAKILELPNELLILILFDTEETDIISLALTCRRLNHIAFGYYLSPPSFSPLSYIRQSISLRDTLSVSYNRGELHMFEALRLAFFKKPIPRIIYTYFSSPSFTSEIRHASLFFETGPSLEKVSLSFYSVYYTKPKPPAARRTMECLLKSLTCVRVYQKTFDLELSGSNIVVDDTAPSPSFNGILLRTPTKLTLKGTTFLFKHPFLYWTINSMDACRLSNLHLANVDIGPYLNLITLDTLRELTVACHTVTQVELSTFLSRHDGIVTLLVHNIADIPNGDAALKTKADKAIAKGALPKVHMLQMPPKYLLSWLRARASLRSLKVLHLEYRVPDSQLQDILHALASRSETTPLHTLMLPLYELSKTSLWVDIPMEVRAEPHMKRLLQLHAPPNKYDEMPVEMMERLASAVAMFPDVKTLNIRSQWSYTGKTWHNDLRKLLREKCPRLTHTDFDCNRIPIGIAYDIRSKK